MSSAAQNLNLPPKFPDLLRSWRRSRKLSQGSLALNAGVSQRHLSFLESGRSSPSREMVVLLAGSLSLPLREKKRSPKRRRFCQHARAQQHRRSRVETSTLCLGRHAQAPRAIPDCCHRSQLEPVDEQ